VIKLAFGEGLAFDVSIPRRESKSGPGHKDFKVQGDPAMSVEEAARRRDFTMNSISADPLTGEYFDPFNGIHDLDQRVLRVTDHERFQDDPLRVYRAVQFTARMGLSVDPESFALMQEMVERGDLAYLKPERVTEELKKLLLKGEKPSLGFELARQLGIVEKYWPELHALIGVEQEPEWHPEGDVWIHTMMVVDEAAKIIRRTEDAPGFRRWITTEDYAQREKEKTQVMLGALCHDFGKPSTTKPMEKDGVMRIRSLGHEEAGEAPTRAFCDRLKFSKDEVEAAVSVAREHLKPFVFAKQLEDGKVEQLTYVNMLRKLLKRIHPTPWNVLVAASEADSRGRTVPGCKTKTNNAGETLRHAVIEHKLDLAPTKKLLDGRDLIGAFGMKPGPEIGQWQKAAEEARDAGEIKTKEEALEWVRKNMR
jgi:tRNA nucleotidyltransferase (CCA-adding enzyme)